MAYDAVVIGAGLNGLATAVHLAAKGWSVAVVERNAEPGGAVKTQELTLAGFRHDLYAMNLSMFAGSGFFAAYRDRLIANGLALVGADHCFATAFPDGTWLGVSKDLDATAARIATFSPRDAEAWRNMVAAFGSAAPYIFGLLGAPMPSAQALKIVWRAWRARGTGWLIETAQMLRASPRAFLDRHFESDRLKTMASAWGMHLDFAPDIAGGALFPYAESMSNQAFGMVIGAGGADTIIRAMVKTLGQLGGTLLTNAEAARVRIAGGKANGVVLADGRALDARRAVIADLHPRLLFDRLLPGAPGQSRGARRIAALRPGPGTMMVHLALSGQPDWTAGDELKSFAYVHLAPSLAAMSKTYNEMAAGMLPAEPVLVVGQPTAIDPTRAPAGRHILWVQVRVLPAVISGDAAGTIAARDWDAASAPYAERVLDLIERYAPGLRGKILGSKILSPLDLERDNPCLVGGDSLHGSHHLDQYFWRRPALGWSRYRTPVQGLYMVGAATWPGAGTGAGSGFMLGKMLAGAL
ncbi:MAG TPA: NAD(P)/FAD-dependent oxidoreductase [Stellaceae bacterium]